MNKLLIENTIVADGFLPLFYHDDYDVALKIVKTLYHSGIRVVEFTNRGTNALKTFVQLKKIQKNIFPDLFLGAGTVKTSEDAEKFIESGADFVVSPIVNSDVARLAHENDILWIPGCMTPNEIFAASSLKASLIKIFPASVVGPNFVSAIKEVFPNVFFIATGCGSIESENLSKWFQAGVSAVGIGSKLITKEVLADQQYGQLLEDCTKVRTIIKFIKDQDKLNK